MKAHSNWEKKSQWLLTEIVKYDSYIDSLQGAMALRLKKRGEKGPFIPARNPSIAIAHISLHITSLGASTEWR